MTITIRTWASQGDFQAYLLDFPLTVVVDGEAFASPEELWKAYLDGLFSDYRDLTPEESDYDDKAFHELAPDYEEWSDRVWGWAQFWGNHLQKYASDREYAAGFDAFRGQHLPGPLPEMVASHP